MKKDKKQTAATQPKSDGVIQNAQNESEIAVIDESAAQTEQVQPAQETAAAEKIQKKERIKTADTKDKDVVQMPAKKERILSIDRFRGIYMFLMVCSFILPLFSCFDFLAPVVEHGAEGFQILPGVSFADLFAAMFIFVIGLTMVRSFKSREQKFGTRMAFWQLATRFLALIGIGILINGFSDGWAKVFDGSKTFAQLDTNAKVFGIMLWIAIALLIVMIISLFVKNEKFKKIASAMLRYFFAIAGVLAIYFLLVSTGEKITAPADGTRYGSWLWDTLQNIGLAGLIALPFVKFDKWGRLTIASIILVVMTVLMQNGLFPLANSILEGGIFGGFSWACILLLGSVFAELKDDKRYWVFSSLMLLISVVLIVSFDFIAAKRGCTPVYALFCASISSMVWGGLNMLNNWQPKFSFFAIWGSNAILTYVTTIILSMLLDFIGVASVHAAAAVFIWLAIMALFTVVNWLLRRKNHYIRI